MSHSVNFLKDQQKSMQLAEADNSFSNQNIRSTLSPAQGGKLAQLANRFAN